MPRVDQEGVIALDDVRGRWVVLDFWATWCGPCRNAMRNELSPLWARYRNNEEFALIGIGINSRDSAEKQRAFAEREGYDWPMVFDTNGTASSAYNVQAIPHLALIDPEGRLLVSGNGTFRAIDRILTRELGE